MFYSKFLYLTKVSSKNCFHKVSSQHSRCSKQRLSKKSFWAAYLHLILACLILKNGLTYFEKWPNILWTFFNIMYERLMLLPKVLQKMPAMSKELRPNHFQATLGFPKAFSKRFSMTWSDMFLGYVFRTFWDLGILVCRVWCSVFLDFPGYFLTFNSITEIV